MHIRPREDAEVVLLRTRKRSLPSWTLLSASLVLVVWLVYQRSDELVVLWRIPPEVVVALLILQWLYLFLQSARYQVVLEKCSGRQVRFVPWFRMFVIGRFLNLFVPQTGNFYRGLELKRQYGITFTRYLTSLLSAAWISTVLNFALGAFVVFGAHPDLQMAGLPMWLLLAFAALGAVATLVVGSWFSSYVRIPVAGFPRVRGLFTEIIRVTARSLQDCRYVVRISLWTIAGFVQATFMYWLCFTALGVELGVAQVVSFYVILQITTLIAVTPGNLGVQELAFAALGAGIGTGAVEGVLVSAVLRVTGFFALVALALPLGGLRMMRTTSEV